MITGLNINRKKELKDISGKKKLSTFLEYICIFSDAYHHIETWHFANINPERNKKNKVCLCTLISYHSFIMEKPNLMYPKLK